MSEKVSSRLTSEMLQNLLLINRLRESLEVKKDLAKDLRGEYVLAVKGIVRARPDGMINKKIKTQMQYSFLRYTDT